MTLKEGDRVEFTNENGNVVKGTVSELTEGVITGKASVFVEFDDGSSIVGMEFEFTKIEEEWDDGMFFVGDYVKNNCESDSIFYGRKGTIVGYGELYSKHSGRSVIVKMDDDGQESTMMEGEIVKANKETRFNEGDEVVVSDPEMRCYGEHGIVESVQVMEEFASKPTMFVKLIDPVEYLLYGEECFESVGEFYENEEEDDMIGVNDIVFVDDVEHEHAGKRGVVVNVGYYDKYGVEGIQVRTYCGQDIIEPRETFSLISEEDLAHEDQEEDLNPAEVIQKQMEEYHTGEIYRGLMDALEEITEQQQQQEEDQEETINSVQIVFNDGSEVNTIAFSYGSIEDDLLDKLNHTNHSIRIGNIVTKVDNINYVRVNEVG